RAAPASRYRWQDGQMPVEPIDPDDLAHDMQSERLDEEESVTEPHDRPIEAPEVDVLEQQSDVEGDDDDE
ncbi:MAG: hypothetical protein QOD72_2858, partial [Acidimicrobiaceae bacterium]|nr:hypothetical protein [Acidimicrobiaceae bacterium]